MPIDKGVMHADIGQPTAKKQRVDLQATQQNLEVGAEKGGITALFDQVVIR